MKEYVFVSVNALAYSTITCGTIVKKFYGIGHRLDGCEDLL
jgi:hypothetical protein